jgi:hypothetical protein
MIFKNNIIQLNNFHLVIITILFLCLSIILYITPNIINVYTIKTNNSNFIDLTGASDKLLINSLKVIPAGSFVKFNFSIDTTQNIWLPRANSGESYLILYPNKSDKAILLIDSMSSESQGENFTAIADPNNNSIIFKVITNNISKETKLTNLDAIRLSAKNTFKSLNQVNFVPNFTLQTAIFSDESNELAFHHKILKSSDFSISFIICVIGFAISLIKLMYNLLIK